MFFPVILGTAREGRRSEAAARYVVSQVKEAGFETDLIDVKDATGIRATGEKFERQGHFSDLIRRADGLIIVSPEYNHGYPGELKLFLDSFYGEYKGKPVGICGVSAGSLGGARMVEQLRLVAIELGLVPLHAALYFSNVQSLFDDKGAIRDASYAKRVQELLSELSSRSERGRSA